MRNTLFTLAACAAMTLPGAVQAQLASPNGALPSGVSIIGGVVADLVGTNGTRIVSQLSASSLFIGDPAGSPITIGTQTGFTSSILASFGGGLSSAAFRFSLYDGDTQAGNFDVNDNFLLVNGANLGNWSTVATSQTDGTGNVIGSPQLGFGNNILNSGWFTTSNTSLLNTIWTGMQGGSVLYQWGDNDPNDQYLDFTQGIDASLINVGSGPVQVNVPEPASLALVGAGLLGLAGAGRRRRTVRHQM